MSDVEQAGLTALTVQLLSAYVSNNTVPSEQLAGLIETTRTALAGNTEPAPAPEPEFPPAVSIRQSLASKDHILSLIDGKPYKTLARHLKHKGLTPKEYRERYGLPKDYPMVAPTYSEHRRAVASKYGLGRRIVAKSENAGSAEEAVVAVAPISGALTKAPRVVKSKAAPKRAAKSKDVSVTEKAVAPVGQIAEAPTKSPRVGKAKAAPKRAANPKTLPAAEAATPVETISDAPVNASRVSKPKAASRRTAKAAKSPTTKDTSEVAPSAEAGVPKSRSRKPKVAEQSVDTPAPKSGRTKAEPSVEAPVKAAPKRARKPKAAAETA